MPKIKTKKAAAKRFKFSATGKIKFKRAGMRHNLGHKNASGKLKLRAGAYLFDGDEKHIRKCLPYGNQKVSR